MLALSPYLINYIASLWVTTATTLGMAAFVAMQGWEVRANRRFVLFNLSVAWWSFFQALLPLAGTYEMACVINVAEHLSIVFISTFFFHFVYDLVELKQRFWLRFHYALSFFFLLMIPTGLLINGVTTTHRWIPYMIRPGPLYMVMTAWFLAESTQGVVALFKTYRRSTGAARNRMKYLAWGALIGYAGGCGNYLYVFGLDLPIFNPGGTYGVPIYVAMTAYAIVRHRLMDINVVLRKTVLYTLLYSFCLAIFGFVVFFLGQWVVLGGINGRLVMLSMVGLLLVVAVVHPLDRYLTRLTDRILFREKYQYQQTLKTASAGMGRVRNLPKLLTLIARVIVRRVKVTHATVFLKDRQRPHYVVVASHGRLKKPAGLIRLDENSPLVWWLSRHLQPAVYDELKLDFKQRPKGEPERWFEKLGEVVKEMERLQAAVCVPSFMGGKLKGILMLGDKLSGDMYNQEDLDIFSTLANQAAMAVENAEAYEEIRDTRDQLVHSERLATIGKFASDMAHEIKNPLQAIRTFLEFLPEKYNDPEFRNRFSKIAKAEVDRISQLVRDLALYASPRLPTCKPVEIHQLMDNVLELLETDLYQHGIDVRKIYWKADVVAEVDRDQIKQVFLNLLMNAIDAMPLAQKLDHILQIVITPSEGDVCISIGDTGCGIPAGQLPSLFAPFFTTKAKGSGLGLSIVQNILKAHHGKIYVESQEGVSTTVILSIPLRQPKTPASAQVA